MKILINLLMIFIVQITFSQNYVTYSPLSQSKTTNSGVEVTATVVASCFGNSSTSILITPSYCAWEDGLIGINYSNGTYLTPGQNSTITFRFRKTVSSNFQFVYKFSTNSSCLSPQINITINYVGGSPPPQTCNLPKPTNLVISNIQANSVTCSWNTISGAASYVVYLWNNSLGLGQVVSTNSIVISSLEAGKNYMITVRARCTNGGNSDNFENIYFTTLCPTYSLPPTNVSATPNGIGYTINFTPISNYYGNYTLDYIDLSNNSTGSQMTYNGDFFYYVSPPKSFQFRIRPSSCPAPSSNWITIVPSTCPINNYPSSLSFSTQSVCGSTPGRCCGYGQFSWSAVSGAGKYEIEYMGVNLTNAAVPPVSGTFQTTSINTVQPTQYACNSNQAGTWILKYRVRSQCSNGTWSNFSPWSANFAW